MPKSRLSAACVTRPAVTIAAVDSSSTAWRSARWIVTGTTRSCGDGQHHHRRRIAAIAGQLGEVFGVAGMPEPGAVQRVLVDRVGDDRGGAAGLHIGDRAYRSRGSPAARRPAFGRPGSARMLPPTGTHRQRLGEYRRRVSGRRERAHRHVPAEPRAPIAASRSGSSIR